MLFLSSSHIELSCSEDKTIIYNKICCFESCGQENKVEKTKSKAADCVWYKIVGCLKIKRTTSERHTITVRLAIGNKIFRPFVIKSTNFGPALIIDSKIEDYENCESQNNGKFSHLATRALRGAHPMIFYVSVALLTLCCCLVFDVGSIILFYYSA